MQAAAPPILGATEMLQLRERRIPAEALRLVTALLGLGQFGLDVSMNEQRFPKAKPPVQVTTRCPALGQDI